MNEVGVILVLIVFVFVILVQKKPKFILMSKLIGGDWYIHNQYEWHQLIPLLRDWWELISNYHTARIEIMQK